MINPLDKIKKLRGRSWKELRTRGGQAVSVYSEQVGLSGGLPTDDQLFELIKKSQFGTRQITAEILFQNFYESSLISFFPSFAERDKTLELFRRHFEEKSADYFIEKANQLIEGRFDLMGYKNLHFGAAVDWHFEPVSGKRSPIKHWKQFDELDAEETGDKKIIWELNRHQHFFTLGVAYWLTGDESYAATFVRHLDGWMHQNQPGMGINWSSSLENAFRSISWIWAFNFFRNSDCLTPEVFKEALKFLYLHGKHIEKYLSTYYSPNTHLTGEALALYYLGTQLPFFESAAEWRETGEKILFAELDSQILADGVYFEQSTWYQRYTADFYTHFLILKTLAGDEAPKDLQEKLAERLQATLDFLMYITRPDGTTPLVGDDDGGRILPFSRTRPDDFRPVLSTGAALFERGDYKFAAEALAEETVWLLGLEGVQAFENLRAKAPEKDSTAFVDGGYYIMREGWAETDDYLLIDGGNMGALTGGHSHADNLAIELAIGGRTILVDSGTYTYHESKEMRDYFRSTEAHNTLTIDEKSSSEPGEKFSWQTKAETTVNSWLAQDRFDFFEAEHNGCQRFSENPATHTRSILFLKNDYWIMRDFAAATGEHSFQLNFHFNSETDPQIEQAENTAPFVSETYGDKTGLRLFTFGDNGDWRRKQSPFSKVYGEKTDAPFMQFASSGTGAQEFFTFLLPTEAGLEKPVVFETEVVGGRAFVVKFLVYWDLFIFADGDRAVQTEFFDTDFRFSWARLAEGERIPEEFVLIGGKSFSIGGREIINSQVDFATARRFGNKLNVRARDNIFSVSLPQQRPKTLILNDLDES